MPRRTRKESLAVFAPFRAFRVPNPLRAPCGLCGELLLIRLNPLNLLTIFAATDWRESVKRRIMDSERLARP